MNCCGGPHLACGAWVWHVCLDLEYKCIDITVAISHKVKLNQDILAGEYTVPFKAVFVTLTQTALCFSCLLCQQNEFEEQATRKVDDLLESYMGIRDLELGKIIQTHIWSRSCSKWVGTCELGNPWNFLHLCLTTSLLRWRKKSSLSNMITNFCLSLWLSASREKFWFFSFGITVIFEHLFFLDISKDLLAFSSQF